MEGAACVERFQAFLRIPTVTCDGANGLYREAATFLKDTYAAYVDTVQVLEFKEGKPIVLFSFLGTEPQLPSLLCNGHYDVVPVDHDKWTMDPFGAEIKDGKIYARGSQDMKCVLSQLLEVLRRWHLSGYRPKRSVHVSCVPDEETGGHEGAALFCKSEAFRQLNVGFAMDEGLANPSTDGEFTLFYGERAVWWLIITAEGDTGHASKLVKEPAQQKLLRVCNRFLAFRETQEAAEAKGTDLGDLVTLNLTALQGGVTSDGGETFALNVIPTTCKAGFDMRVPPCMPLAEMQQRIDEWTDEPGVSYRFVTHCAAHGVTSLDRTQNPFWAIFEDTCTEIGIKLQCRIFPAATDSRFFRGLGIPCLGFSPMTNTPVLLHDHDEFLAVDVFLRGIAIYEKLLINLSSHA